MAKKRLPPPMPGQPDEATDAAVAAPSAPPKRSKSTAPKSATLAQDNPTKPPGKTAATGDAEFRQKLIDSEREKLEAAERFVAELLPSFPLDPEEKGAMNRKLPLTVEQRRFFAALGWNEDRVRGEFNRMRRVEALKPAAGTAEELKAAQTQAETTQAKLEAEAPALREQLDDLQRQLSTLEHDARKAQGKVSGMLTARETLRRLVPKFIRVEASQTRSMDVREINVRESRARTRVSQLETASGTNGKWAERVSMYHGDELRAIDSLAKELLPADHAGRPRRDGKGGFTWDEQAFREWQQEKAAELPEAIAELAAARDELASAEQHSKAVLDYYVNQM